MSEINSEDGPFTYRRLFDYLKMMSDVQLDQEVQILPPDPTGEPTRLQPVYGIDTIESYCHVDDEISETRSAVDFQHHPEQIVMLSDFSPFDKEGNNCFTLEEGGMRGNKTGKLYPDPFPYDDNGD